MKSRFAISLVGLALALALSLVPAAGCAAAQTVPGGHPVENTEVVHVALPTGEQAVDHASILTALDEVQPGGTIHFGPGTYLVGEMITVSIPQVTLLGHPDGTILRGCETAAYEEMSRDLSRATDWSGRWAAMSRCGIMELTGGHATVRNLTFEYTDRGLGLGCCLAEPAFRPSGGGYLIENNTFRNSRNAIRASLASADTTVIRKNQFINVYHAVSAAASHFHVTDNDISVPEPDDVPGIGHPGFAIQLEPVPPGPGGTISSTINVCEHNVIAGNRIEGHPDGIILSARPGTKCRHNVIRDNAITVRRGRLPPSRPYVGPARIISEEDSTVVGVPLALVNDPVSWVGDDSAPQGSFEGNLIEGNHIAGAEGLGIVVYRASRNRVVNNTITGVTVREPYPGNTIRPSPDQGWDEANGSGIWVSPGSDENEIAGNTFEDLAGFAVVVEGDRNRVDTRDLSGDVLDNGTDNRGTSEQHTGPVQEWLASTAVRLDTVEPGSDLTDLEPLRDVVGDARIVALGEPTHGNREVFQLKHRMIEFLVTRMGFNVFALESPMAETFDLNAYVLTGRGDPAKALAGIYYWTWDTEEVLAVVEWIREYNADPAHHQKVTFHGFDVQDPERAARVTLEYLQRVDPMLAESVLPALGIFATPFSLPEYGGRRPIIPQEGHPPAVRAVGEVVSSLDARKDDYIAATSTAEWTLARQHARLLARYIEASSHDARDWGTVRDRTMAENVQWILKQEGDDAKVILWAHNSHVANAAPWDFELMGSHLRRRFGAEMVIFGFLFNRGGFRALDAGVSSEGMRNFTVGPAPEGTVEAMFSAAGLDLAVVDLRRITPGGAVARWFREPRPTRHSGGGYDESDPGRYLLEYALPEAFNALVYVDSTTPVRHVNGADYDVFRVREQRLPAPGNLDFESGSPGEAPEGWLAWSRHRRLGFEMATTTERPHGGSHAAVVHRAPGQRYGEVAGSLSQRIDATPFRGGAVRLRAAARAEVAGNGNFAFVRLAIDGPASESVHDPDAPSFDSLDELRVASPEWRIQEIVANVPEDAVVISYGLFLAGFGSAWIDDVSIEVLPADSPDPDRFVDIGGTSLHYLDFGGEGLPLVFVHSEAWDAHTFAEFAPRFADGNRVLAVTRPGYGQSEAHPDGFGVDVQAGSLVDFLDAMGIEQAVFAGNASATAELTYLAAHHPERVAGLVYLTGLAVPWVDAHESDPTRAFEMFMRANPGSGDEDARVRARREYRPKFVHGDRPPIGVPALAFVARSGTMGQEHAIGALALVGSPLMREVRSRMPPSPVRDHLERLAADEAFRRRELEQIPDPEARAYFLRLAADDSMQAEVQRYHEETIRPAVLEGQEEFRRAFGEHLHLVRLNVEQVVGYEYRDAPELIEPHVRRFLERVNAAEAGSGERFTGVMSKPLSAASSGPGSQPR